MARTTNWQKQQEEIKKQAIREMRSDYVKGVPVRLIAKEYGISRRHFYYLVSPNDKEQQVHNQRLWQLNKELREENYEEDKKNGRNN